MKSSPFYSSRAPMAALAAALSGSAEYIQALNAAQGYCSRGKGLGQHSGKKWGSSSSGRYAGVSNGEREMARRQRQIATGMLKASPVAC